jgi:protocatechuate 3,4-dioxygenase beta subunit
MRNVWMVGVAVSGALTPGVVALNQTPQSPATGVVAGQVVDATTGRALGGAVVTLAIAAGADPVIPASASTPPAAQRRGVAVANSEGRFVFRDVPAGSFAITTTLDGFAPGMSGRKRPGGPGQPFQLADGARLANVRIEMWKLAAISGYVRDGSGEPVVGLAMNALRLVMNGGRPELTFSGGEATDDRGHYRAFNLMPGSYLLGFRANWNTISVAAADEYRAAVTAGTAGAITQQWSSTGAIQIQGKRLTLGDWAAHFNSWEPAPLPGPDGTVLRYPNLFYPNAVSPSDATAITLAPGDERSGIDFTLNHVAAVRVSGVLTGPDGPAPNHGVRLYPADRSIPAFPVPVAYGQTDAAGRFALLGVTPGSYVVHAYRVQPAVMFRPPSPPGAGAPPGARAEPAAGPPTIPVPLFAAAPVTVGASHVDDVSLTLRPGTKISGRVLFEGASQPAAAALQKMTVTVRPLFGTLPGSTDARVDADARFSFAGFPPGPYVLFAAAAPGPEWTISSFRITGIDAAGRAFVLGDTDVTDAVLTFTDKVTTLSGNVTTGTARSDLAGGTVVIFPADTEGWINTGMSVRRMASAPVSAGGTFSLRVPLPGDYVAVAVPPEIAPDLDREFVKRVLPSAVRVSLAAGESKTLSLTLAKIK